MSIHVVNFQKYLISYTIIVFLIIITVYCSNYKI